MGTTHAVQGPDLTRGVPLDKLEDGVPLAGHADGEAVLLVRRGADVFAIGATCTHYGGPLADGIVVGDEIRCPWHHACFSLRTGAVIAAPALNPLPRWAVEVRAGTVFVTGRHADAAPLAAPARAQSTVRRVVILGGGAAGSAVAEGLRREGFDGDIAVIDEDPDAPYDRPNLSKDYLAGTAPDEWLPLRPDGFYADQGIRRIQSTARALDAGQKLVTLSGGESLSCDALVLATGASPIRPPLPGAGLPHVHVLRTLADCRRIIGSLEAAPRIVIAGASFIGMEAAAALRARNAQVVVVAPEEVPFTRVLGPVLGESLKQLHVRHGVEFRLGRTLAGISERAVQLDDGSMIPADLVLLGIGVRPRLDLAADLQTDRGIVVNEYLETSVAGVYAAGDIARFPNARGAGSMRIEHWVVAQRQGRTVARNILGARTRFTSVPFFWTQQYDTKISYVGHADEWSHIDVDGNPDEQDCGVSFMRGDQLLAHASIGRDRDSLKMERELEQWSN